MANLLELVGVHTHIGQFHILQGVDLAVPDRGVTVLLGRNGAGKTTTLRTIMGLHRASAGRIEFAGRPLVGLPPFQVARLGIGYVPEDRGIFRSLSVEENLLLVDRGDAWRRKRDWVHGLFPDLARFARRSAGALSGGQQQMLAIARALIPDNRLLLVDEPSKGLAPIVVEDLRRTLSELKAKMPILLVEQNLSLALGVADRYVVLDDGCSVRTGEMAELERDTELAQALLGVGSAEALGGGEAMA